MSLTERFLCGFLHFCLYWAVEDTPYNLTHTGSVSISDVQIIFFKKSRRKKWFGVSGSKSFGSSDSDGTTFKNGFNLAENITKIHHLRFAVQGWNITTFSWGKWSAPKLHDDKIQQGVDLVHSIPLLAKALCILLWSRASLGSLSAPTFVHVCS